MNTNNKALSISSLLVAIAAFLSVSATQLNAQNVSDTGDQGPRALSREAPVYSHDLRHEEIEGQVVVSFVVTPTGDVANPFVVSSTEERLVRPTLLALSKWKYLPATRAGVPITSRVIETVDFRMPDLSR
jgi:TonB family protein